MLKTKLYKWWKPPPVQKVVKSGLHFNILSSDEVNQVIVRESEKQRACEDPQKFYINRLQIEWVLTEIN